MSIFRGRSKLANARMNYIHGEDVIYRPHDAADLPIVGVVAQWQEVETNRADGLGTMHVVHVEVDDDPATGVDDPAYEQDRIVVRGVELLLVSSTPKGSGRRLLMSELFVPKSFQEQTRERRS